MRGWRKQTADGLTKTVKTLDFGGEDKGSNSLGSGISIRLGSEGKEGSATSNLVGESLLASLRELGKVKEGRIGGSSELFVRCVFGKLLLGGILDERRLKELEEKLREFGPGDFILWFCVVFRIVDQRFEEPHQREFKRERRVSKTWCIKLSIQN